MQYTSPPRRPNLSDELAATLRQMITDGRLAAGERINEVQLAASLGVSRTPLREALSALVSERALTSVPRRGFFVCELTLEEGRNIYPIRALLDPEALRLAGIPDSDGLDRLDALADQLADVRTADDAIRLDDAWHYELWRRCPNPTLVELIEQFMQRTRRYELASMRERRTLELSCESKREIVAELRAGRLITACRRLERSLEDGAVPVLEWLSHRSPETRET